MELRTISANFTFRTFISVFCAALDWSLLTPDVELPVFCCTPQIYDWLTMTFERRHCVGTPREMAIGNTALYRLVSSIYRSPGIGVLHMPITLHLFLDTFPFATAIAQLDIVVESDCQTSGLLEPGEVHSSEDFVGKIINILRLFSSDPYPDLIAPCYPLFSHSTPTFDLHV